MSKIPFAVFVLLMASTVAIVEGQALSDTCLACICKTLTGCNLARKCDKATCGPFKLSWGYWADAGKPTKSADQSPDDADAYKDCALDPGCAIKAVEGYMEKFSQDCNGDGVVDCYDLLSIHVLGGYGCNGGIPANYLNTFRECAPPDSSIGPADDEEEE